MTFTTCTLIASFILFRGFNTSDAVNTISLLCGFLTIFTGVYLLNLSREDPNGENLGIAQGDHRGAYHEVDGIPTDGLTGLQTRYSMSRRSEEHDRERHRRSTSWSLRSPSATNGGRWSKDYGARAGGEGEMYDVESNVLHDLAEDSDENTSGDSNQKRTSFGDHGNKRTASGQAASASSRKQTSEHVRMGVKSFDHQR